jgi:hypothetical protein
VSEVSRTPTHLSFVLAGTLVIVGTSNALAEDGAAAALYVRADSDHTTVISPHARASKLLGRDTSVDVTYAADVWSSASIDIVSAASTRPVTEQRDELDLALSHELEDVSLNAAYRFSTEHDYTSHGATLGASYDFANNAATLETNLHAIADVVGLSGNPRFARDLFTFDGELSFIQVIDPVTFVKLTYELARIEGFQASPYRWVGEGGDGFGCRASVRCWAEHVPDTRTRHAMAVLVRRAFTESWSVGINYRYYFDDWGLGSHTALVESAWSFSDKLLFSVRYRFYRQGAVDFYRAIYPSLSSDQYRTRDRELSGLTYHRFGATLDDEIDLRDGSMQLIATLAVSGNLYRYDDFVGLTAVRALEVSAALTFRL